AGGGGADAGVRGDVADSVSEAMPVPACAAAVTRGGVADFSDEQRAHRGAVANWQCGGREDCGGGLSLAGGLDHLQSGGARIHAGGKQGAVDFECAAADERGGSDRKSERGVVDAVRVDSGGGYAGACPDRRFRVAVPDTIPRGGGR